MTWEENGLSIMWMTTKFVRFYRMGLKERQIKVENFNLDRTV